MPNNNNTPTYYSLVRTSTSHLIRFPQFHTCMSLSLLNPWLPSHELYPRTLKFERFLCHASPFPPPMLANSSFLLSPSSSDVVLVSSVFPSHTPRTHEAYGLLFQQDCGCSRFKTKNSDHSCRGRTGWSAAWYQIYPTC